MASRARQIADKIKTELATISTAAGYNYTPSVVVRVDDFDIKFLRKENPVTYMIRPQPRFPVQKVTGQIDRKIEIGILAAVLWQPNTTDPYFIQSKTQWDIQEELIEDVEKKLEGGDLTLGGLCYNLELLDWALNFDFEEGHLWAPVMATIAITYRRDRATP